MSQPEEDAGLFGRIALRQRFVTVEQLAKANKERSRSGQRLGAVLVKLKMIDQVQLATILALMKRHREKSQQRDKSQRGSSRPPPPTNEWRPLRRPGQPPGRARQPRPQPTPRPSFEKRVKRKRARRVAENEPAPAAAISTHPPPSSEGGLPPSARSRTVAQIAADAPRIQSRPTPAAAKRNDDKPGDEARHNDKPSDETRCDEPSRDESSHSPQPSLGHAPMPAPHQRDGRSPAPTPLKRDGRRRGGTQPPPAFDPPVRRTRRAKNRAPSVPVSALATRQDVTPIVKRKNPKKLQQDFLAKHRPKPKRPYIPGSAKPASDISAEREISPKPARLSDEPSEAPPPAHAEETSARSESVPPPAAETRAGIVSPGVVRTGTRARSVPPPAVETRAGIVSPGVVRTGATSPGVARVEVAPPGAAVARDEPDAPLGGVSLLDSGADARSTDPMAFDATPAIQSVGRQRRFSIAVATPPPSTLEPLPWTPPASTRDSDKLNELLRQAAHAGASDVHIHANMAPIMRRYGRLVPLGDEPPLTSSRVGRMLRAILTPWQRHKLDDDGEVDLAYMLEGIGRFRANLYHHHGGCNGVFHVISASVPTLHSLGLPDELRKLTDYAQGLILVTGPSGSGKTSTLAALLNIINESRDDHILTIEDPIEYMHASRRCLVNQRQVGRHTESFARGLRGALREDPDVICIGELRDLETVSLAMSAAETGHLVLATLHTGSAIGTINRVVGSYPPGQQPQVRSMLSESLRAILSQRLVPLADGNGVVAALEILYANTAVSNLIRDNRAHQIASVMQMGRAHGMQTLDEALKKLLRDGYITQEVAIANCLDPRAMEEVGRGAY